MSIQKTPNKRTIIWDSGASISISPNRDDFVGEFKTFTTKPKLKGISRTVNVKGQGYASWSIEDTNGMLRTLKIPCLYVPSVPQRLLSTTSLLEQYPDEHIDICNGKLLFTGSEDSTRGSIVAYIDPTNNLPTSDMYDHTFSHKFVDEFDALTTVVSNENYNLTEPEKELLRWHQRLAHIDFNKIKFLFRSGVLAKGEANRALQTAASKLRSHPRCAACQFGKQCQVSTPTTTKGKVSDSVGAISRDRIQPGQEVSVDHFVCKTRGRLFTSRGKTVPSEMYAGGCVFVDHFSGMIHVELQKNLNTHETLDAKNKFEAMALDYGVVPQTYLSDNGPAFASQEFAARMKQFEQISKFAGPSAHHHNGIAERSIRTVISIARTMMMHAAIHWPEVSDPSLWPMAVKHAAYVYNRMPNVETGLCPYDLFTKQSNHIYMTYTCGGVLSTS
jgi:GAG-pre-integrase domain